MNFFINMSALSARRRIESLNSGLCRFNVDVLQQFQQDHGAEQWSVREETRAAGRVTGV